MFIPVPIDFLDQERRDDLRMQNDLMGPALTKIVVDGQNVLSFDDGEINQRVVPVAKQNDTGVTIHCDELLKNLTKRECMFVKMYFLEEIQAEEIADYFDLDIYALRRIGISAMKKLRGLVH